MLAPFLVTNVTVQLSFMSAFWFSAVLLGTGVTPSTFEEVGGAYVELWLY